MKRWLGLVTAIATAMMSIGGCGCSSEDCGGALCLDQVSLVALVPAIGGGTWTLTVCQNSDCAAAQITASSANKADGGLEIRYDQGVGGWRLEVWKIATSPQNGDVWSLKVTDQASSVIFEDSRAVSYESSGDSCQSCKHAIVSF